MNEVDVLEIDPKYGVIITTDANLSMEQIEKIRAELGRINLKSCIIAGGLKITVLRGPSMCEVAA